MLPSRLALLDVQVALRSMRGFVATSDALYLLELSFSDMDLVGHACALLNVHLLHGVCVSTSADRGFVARVLDSITHRGP